MENIKVHCRRCRSSKLGHNDFEMNLKTNEYYKSCIKCREYDKQFKIKNRDKINAKKREHYQEIKEIETERKNSGGKNQDRLKEILECECGGKYQRRQKWRHVKTEKHINCFKKNIKDYCI